MLETLVAPLFIPSPSQGVWHLGPLPIRAYALCIILGVVAAVWIGERRWQARGGTAGEIGDIAIWAVPFGLVGGRLYHVITDHDLYFGADAPNRPIDALAVWKGGLGIWGAIALGALGAYLVARRRGVRFSALADALAPGLMAAQAIGRFGNYFNQELYGRPTTLPWGLEIDSEHRLSGYANDATYHPTFLYEALWNVAGIAVLLWLERRFRLGRGRVFALYVMIYCVGRGWIEHLRIDTIELNDVAGFRWGTWMAIILFVLALGYFVVVGRRHPGDPALSPYVEGRGPADEVAEASDPGESDAEAASRGAAGTPGEKPTASRSPDD